MKRFLVVPVILLFSLSCYSATFFDKIGKGELPLGVVLNLGSASFKATDTYDETNYVGKFESGSAIGGQLFLVYPIKFDIQLGGNFDWMYSSHTSDKYSVYVFQPSVGPFVRWAPKKYPVDLQAYVNYSYAWVSGESEKACSDILCHGGDFTVNMRGLIFGFRALYSINKHFAVGAFYSRSSQTMYYVPYKFRQSGRYTDLEADVNVSYSQYGLSGIWYPF